MKKICLIILLLSSKLILAQTNIDVDADFILVDKNELVFLKKENGKINLKTEIRFYPTDENRGKRIELRTVPVSDFDIERFNNFSLNGNQYSFVVDVKDIVKQNPKQFKQNILNKPFYYKNSEEEIRVLSLYNNSTFIATECYFEKFNKNTESEWGCNEQDFMNFEVINITKNRRIILFNKIGYNASYDNTWHSDRKYLIDFYGYIIPKKKQIITKFESKDFNLQPELEFLNNLESYDDKSFSWSRQFKFENNFLTDAVFGQKLINKKFDTIIVNNGFIVGKEDELINVYNFKLKDITPKGIQSAFPLLSDKGYAIALINDKIKYITKNGSILEQLPEKEPLIICGFNSSMGSSYLSIKKDSTNYYLDIKHHYVDYDEEEVDLSFTENLFDKDKYDSVNFLDYTMLQNKQTSKSIDFHRFFRAFGFTELIVVENGEKFGLFSLKAIAIDYNDNSKKYPIIELKELLPTEFDFIKLKMGTSHILFSKNGLLGLYGLNEKPKYKNVEVAEYFSRFELPNGQKGWLDTVGNEFLDN